MSDVFGPPGAGIVDHRSIGVPSAASAEIPLRVLLSGLRDHGIFMVSRTGMVLTWNTGAELVHGYPAEEIIGQHFGILLPGSPAAHELTDQLEHARTEGGLQREGWQVRKDGRRFWASQLLIPLHDRLGRLHGFGVVTRVLADRMRAQDLLAVLDAATDAVLGVDSDGLIMFINSAAAALFGYPKSELVGRPVELLVPLQHRETHVARRAGYGRNPMPRPMGGGMVLAGLRRDGSEFPAEVSLSSVDTPRGRIVTALVRDLSGDPVATARRLVDERLQALFEHSPAGQAEVALDGRVVQVNRTLEGMLGHRRGELADTCWRALVDPAQAETMAADLEALTRRGPGRSVHEINLIARSGRRVPAVLSVDLLPGQQGLPARMLWAVIERPAAEPAEPAHNRTPDALSVGPPSP